MWKSNQNGRSFCMACMSVRLSVSIDFHDNRLAGLFQRTQGNSECMGCNVVWKTGSPESCMQSAGNNQARSGHCTGGCNAEDRRNSSVECEFAWMSSRQQQYWRLHIRSAMNTCIIAVGKIYVKYKSPNNITLYTSGS